MADLAATAIGLILIFLFTSLIVTAAQEVVAGLFDLRAKVLARHIRAIIGDPAAEGRFYAHPLIQALVRASGGHPSYIPGSHFAAAALDAAADPRPADAPAHPSPLQQSLTAVRAGADLSGPELRAAVAAWYEDLMDRVSGTYKRSTQWTTIGLGILAAAAFNVDAIAVLNALSSQPLLREAVDAYGRGLAAQGKIPDHAAILAAFEKARLPIGWSREFDWTMIPRAVPGWLLTGLAASLGSAFWFDVLKRIVQLRPAGPKPDAPDEASAASHRAAGRSGAAGPGKPWDGSRSR